MRVAAAVPAGWHVRQPARMPLSAVHGPRQDQVALRIQPLLRPAGQLAKSAAYQHAISWITSAAPLSRALEAHEIQAEAR
jgi:hypothetical protein